MNHLKIIAGRQNIFEFKKTTIVFPINEILSKHIVFTFYTSICQTTKVLLLNPHGEILYNADLTDEYVTLTSYGGVSSAKKNLTIFYLINIYFRRKEIGLFICMVG